MRSSKGKRQYDAAQLDMFAAFFRAPVLTMWRWVVGPGGQANKLGVVDYQAWLEWYSPLSSRGGGL